MSQTQLIRKQIRNLGDAAGEIGQLKSVNGYKQVPLILAPNLDACRFWIQIPHGFSALMQKNGSDAGVWGPGLHFAPPWYTISHLVPWQCVPFDTPVKKVPTADNVFVSIDVEVVFKILRDEANIRAFAYNLGPTRLEKLLQAFLEESIRTMARMKTYSKIFDLMDSASDEQLDNTKRKMNENLSSYGVQVLSLTITNVRMPEDIAKTMEQETTYASLNQKAKVQQEYELLCLEDREFIQKRRQGIEEDKLALAAEGEQHRAAAMQHLSAIEAETKNLIAQIKEQESSQARELTAQSDFRVSQIDAAKTVTIAKTIADGRAAAQRIKTEAEAICINMQAKAQREISKNEAAALMLKAEAEEVAKTKLKSKRHFEEMMHRLNVLKSLAQNNQVALSGNNGDNVLAQLLSGGRNSTILSLNAT